MNELTQIKCSQFYLQVSHTDVVEEDLGVPMDAVVLVGAKQMSTSVVLVERDPA